MGFFLDPSYPHETHNIGKRFNLLSYYIFYSSANAGIIKFIEPSEPKIYTMRSSLIYYLFTS